MNSYSREVLDTIWDDKNGPFSEVINGNLQRTDKGLQALKNELNYYLGLHDPTKGNTMNEEITNTVTEAQPAAPATQLTDAEVEAILASKPIYVTEGDAVEGETIHEGSNVTLH